MKHVSACVSVRVGVFDIERTRQWCGCSMCCLIVMMMSSLHHCDDGECVCWRVVVLLFRSMVIDLVVVIAMIVIDDIVEPVTFVGIFMWAHRLIWCANDRHVWRCLSIGTRVACMCTRPSVSMNTLHMHACVYACWWVTWHWWVMFRVDWGYVPRLASSIDVIEYVAVARTHESWCHTWVMMYHIDIIRHWWRSRRNLCCCCSCHMYATVSIVCLVWLFRWWYVDLHRWLLYTTSFSAVCCMSW